MIVKANPYSLSCFEMCFMSECKYVSETNFPYNFDQQYSLDGNISLVP